MGITSYIADLLEENEMVILPGFGAFVSVYQPARFDENGMFLLPPDRRISFNPEIRTDDGVLLGYLVQRLKMTTPQAHKLLDQFTDDLEYRLCSGEQVAIVNIGVLTKSGNLILFEPERKKISHSGTFGLTPVAARPANINQSQQPETENVSVKPDLKKRKTWIVALMGLAFVLAITLWVLNRNSPRYPDKTASVPVTGARSIPGIIPVAPQDSLSGGNDRDTTENNLQNPVDNAGLYYLIGGSFRSQKNADEYTVEMSGKGYQPVSLGRKGQYYLVALESFKSENEALKALNRLTRENPEGGFWLYHPENK
jgi:nucleoid DNA-binding protein